LCDLPEAFDVTAPSVGYQLKMLREPGLISSERCGTRVYYRVRSPRLRAVTAAKTEGSRR
jgi:ArsR family transcriptional regulator